MAINQELGGLLELDASAQVSNLDWLTVDKDNIPTENPVESIPQLEEAWSHQPTKSLNLITNIQAAPKMAGELFDQSAVKDIVAATKRELMSGLTVKGVAAKIATMYPMTLIAMAQDDIKAVVNEQGLLGNVYVDTTCYHSCREAAKALGTRVKTAKYVVGTPKVACASHATGFCSELRKEVVAEVKYDQALVESYESHLKVAGAIGNGDKINSKEALQQAFLALKAPKMVAEASVQDQRVATTPEIQNVRELFVGELENKQASQQQARIEERFQRARPILAHMQNLMLKGKTGSALKELLANKYPDNVIREFAPEIKKMAGLQGLLGNVYVDISLYKDAHEASEAIRAANTSPMYLVQTHKVGQFDDTLEKVARDTSTQPLPKDGNIDVRVAYSYVDDLHYAGRLSKEASVEMRGKLAAGVNPLAVVRESFMSSQGYKKPVPQGGQTGSFEKTDTPAKVVVDPIGIKEAAKKALVAGLEIEKVEDKVSTMLPRPEAVGLVRGVLASLKEVDPKSLTRCVVDKYQLSREATLKMSDKCAGCILNATVACAQQGLRFAGVKRDFDAPDFQLDAHTEKVLFSENPDVSRQDMGTAAKD